MSKILSESELIDIGVVEAIVMKMGHGIVVTPIFYEKLRFKMGKKWVEKNCIKDSATPRVSI